MTDSITLLYIKIAFNFCIVSLSIMFTYLGINGEAIMILAILLMIDYVTGVMKARALGESITSNKMKYGAMAKMSVLLIPIVLAMGAKTLGTDFNSILFSGINILVFSEIYSIIGNVYSLRTHKELPEYDAVALIGQKVKRYLIRVEKE